MADANDYQAKKSSLRAILRDDENAADTVEKIRNVVLMCDRLWTHCLLFLKGYMLQKYENDPQRENIFPKVDDKLVLNIFRTLVRSSAEIGDVETRQQKQDLRAFFENHYQATMHEDPEPEPLSMKNLTQACVYLSKEVVTCYETNIIHHWRKHISRFVETAHNKKERMDIINAGDGTAAEKRQQRASLHNELNRVTTDLMNSKNPNLDYEKQSLALYHDWIDEKAEFIMPPNRNVQENVFYDIKASPQDYLYGMIYMGDFVETRAAVYNYNVKLLSAFPLKTQIVPRSIRFDSVMIHDLFDRNRTVLSHQEGTNQEKKDAMWNMITDLNQRIYRGNQDEDQDGFVFNHQMITDGVSCSVLLIKKSKLGKKYKKNNNNAGGGDGVEQVGTPYLTSISPQQRANLSNKILISIDPGLSDLLFCVNRPDREGQVQYRHTQNSRRKDMNVKKNRAQLLVKKQTTFFNDADGPVSVSEWEARGTNFNARTYHFQRFIQYLGFKNHLNSKLRPFYRQTSFRRQRLAQYSKRQQIEMKLLKEFKEKFHPNAAPQDVLVAIGDWEQTIHRFHEPTKGKGIRAVFERAGYHVYLIDEYRTSKMCSKCSNTNAQCEKFRRVPNPRPYRQGEILRHGLVRCTTCWTMWNRDVNAAVNIWKIANAILAEQEQPPNDPNLRPEYLRRNANNNA